MKQSNLKFFIILMIFVSCDGVFAQNQKQQIILQESERLLELNLFSPLKYDRGYKWLSVGMGGYLKQYYSRDTFITFKGARYSSKLKVDLGHAIDWFGEHQLSDGYIPIWYRETTPEKDLVDLNMYLTAPYNRSEQEGGMRQVDHVEQFIEAIYEDYNITKDRVVLERRYIWAEKAWRYLDQLTNDNLITTKRTVYAGPDWADQINRSGKAAFVNAYWYHVTALMGEMSDLVAKPEKRDMYKSKAQVIAKEFNTLFWRKGRPTNCDFDVMEYYTAWVDEEAESGDYFELDSNSLAIAVGLPDSARRKHLLDQIRENFDYYVNPVGATRVLCGTYHARHGTAQPEMAHNGGYWYIVSYFLAAALNRHTNEYGDLLDKLHERTNRAVMDAGNEGLNEWYDFSGRPLGGKTYSWSIAFPLYLNGIRLQLNTTP